jgi:DMSO/TMAO reductase YedYZ molybdopterin-dependent catalytic subunit
MSGWRRRGAFALAPRFSDRLGDYKLAYGGGRVLASARQQEKEMASMNRREVAIGVASLGLGGVGAGTRASEATVVMPFANGARPLVRYPQKRALIRMTTRPPQLETPFSVFDEGPLTPADAFYVRYHLAGAPPDVDPATFRLEVKGHVATPLSLSLAQLQALPRREIIAVNQCSGNSRGFFDPRVAGGQAGNGLMGNARWTGVSLKGLLDKAGVMVGAVQARFAGLDRPVDPDTPRFAKALDIDHARDGEVMLAWAMNGASLPILNGYPLRLVVPGYYGTYWIKHLNEITVLDEPLDNFWMSTAYRIPDNACHCVAAGTAAAKTVPIGRYDVRSFITNLADGAKISALRPLQLRGIAFDGGSGIARVEVSLDGGAAWTGTTLGPDLGRYSFRPWSTRVRLAPGHHELMVRAVSRSGESQPAAPRWNPAGYMRNVVESLAVEAV